MTPIRPLDSICAARIAGAALAAAALLAPLPGWAIDVDPGDFVPAPAGTTAGLLYVQHAERDRLYSQGAKADINPRLTSDVGIMRLVHYTTIGGLTVGPQMLLPFGRLDAGRDTSGLGRTSGVGDVILASPLWVINDPAAGTYLGLAPYLYLPTGSYDPNRPLNLGENRTKFNFQVGFVKSLTEQLKLDLTGDTMFYGKNSDYAAGTTLRQARSYQFQGYLRYQYSAATNVFIGLSQTLGGETRLNGLDRNDASRQRKVSIGASHFILPTTQLMMAVGRDLKVENGFKENLRVNLRLLQVF